MRMTLVTCTLILWTQIATLVCARGFPGYYENENDIDKLTLPQVPAEIPTEVIEAYYYDIFSDISGYESANLYHGHRRKINSGNGCSTVQEVPKELRDKYRMQPHGISSFFEKHTQAYGIPVVGSKQVSNRALQRACYVLRFLLADRFDIRQSYYKRFGYVAIISQNETITSLPTYSFLFADRFGTVRGLGAIPFAPASSAGEENLLCSSDDPSMHEDILVRELAAGILQLAVRHIEPFIWSEIQEAFVQASKNGRWRNTYASHSSTAYFAKGVQSYFNVNGYAEPADGVHNYVNTRVKLRSYDPELFQLVHDVFPCANHFIKRCHSRGNEEYQLLKENCNLNAWNNARKRRRRDKR